MSLPRTGLTAECPECDTVIQFSRKPQLGTFVVCDECGETLEVTSVSPLQLSWAFDDEEDYEDYEDYDEDADDLDEEYEDFDFEEGDADDY